MNPDRLYQLLIDIFGEEYEVKRGQFRINCINPDCDDDTGNLEIDLEKRYFHCWRCHYKGSLRKLLKDYLGWSPDIDEYVSPEDLRKFYSQELFKEEPKRTRAFTGLPDDYVFLGTENLASLVAKKALKYSLSRVSLDEVKKFRIGYCGLGKYKWRVVIPLFENEKAIYFVTRAFIGGIVPVYKYPKIEECGIGKSSVVFNLDGVREEKVAVITEGIFDAIRVGNSGVAILGTELSEEQLYKLISVAKKFYVLLDNDAIDKAVKIVHQLMTFRVDVRLVVPPSGDPADYSRETIHGWLRDAPPFTFIQELHLRIKK